MVRYYFKGDIYYFDEYLGFFSGQTKAVSIKKAISNFHFQAKNECNFYAEDHLILEGKLTVQYSDGEVETYKVSGSEYTQLTEHPLRQYLLKFVKPSKKQDKYNFVRPSKLNWEESQVLKRLKEKVTTPVDMCTLIEEYLSEPKPKERVLQGTIEINDDVYYWDDEEQVYWKDGIKYGEYLTGYEDLEYDD